MAELLPSLLVGMLPRIGQRPPIAGGIKSWLQSANFIPETLSPNAVAAIRVEDFGGLVPYISYDYERFALSSIESLASASIRTKLADLSWPLLKTYYAGFFAAHSIMRSRGAGVVNLSSNQTKKIRLLAELYGADFSGFESGNYFYQILEDADGDSIIHWRLATKGSGAHDGFWRDFCQFLRDDSALAANAKLPDANDYVAGTEDISRAILAAGGSGGIWLSAVRNEINYQQLHDVWLPLTRKITGKDLKKSIAFRKSNTIRLDNSQRKEPLETFTNISLFLSCLNIEIASHIAANSTVGKGFGQKYRSVKEIIAPALKI